MVKKEEKKQAKKKNSAKKKAEANGGVEKLNVLLIENFVNLQKAMTNLTAKFDSLSDQISKLLQLFEISARSFAEKLSAGTGINLEKDREFLEKLNKLLEQNKVIAKGLTLMEEKLKERIYRGHPAQIRRMPQPGFPPSPRATPATSPGQGYIPSTLEKEKGKIRETE
jgi:hypothetical protein